MEWDFAVLGTLRVTRHDRVIPVPANRQRALLATLLLNRGETVSVPALVDRVWGSRAPAHAKAALHSLVRRLRSTLTIEDHPGELIATRASGYVLDLPPAALDLARFDTLVAAGLPADPHRRADLLRDALALWRGDPLADVDSEVLHREDVPALTERWARATEVFFDTELTLGRHTEIVAELRQATRRSPLREGLWAQLMLALYRSGRQAEALDAFHRLAAILADELGVDPGPAVLKLRDGVLRADPALSWRPPAATPTVTPAAPPMFQLPADTGGLHGRAATVAAIRRSIGTAVSEGRLPLVSVSGAPGVGKTALAVHLGHQLADEFPDGQWYVRLRGQQQTHARPLDVLAELLTYSGVRGAAQPATADARATALRAALAGRRVLIVLDDAASAEQVEPLLPGAGGCAVIVTSRSTLGALVALHGGRAIGLDPLSPQDAVDLLTAVFQDHGFSVAPDVVRDLAGLCGNLPLALRIVAANLATAGPTDAHAYVRRLRDGDRLGGLSVPGDPRVTLRAAIAPSYQRLGAAERRALRLLGSTPTDCFTIEDLAALTDVDWPVADALLRTLTSSHLVRPARGGRFATHDLIRLYAAEQSHLEDTADQRAEALSRLFHGYLATADALARRSYPRMAFLPQPAGPVRRTAAAALPEQPGWFRAEYANLLAAIRHLAQHGPREIAWHLADRMRGYLQETGAHGEWRSVAELGLAQAHLEGDDQGVAAMQASLATLSASRADYADARRRFTTALTIQLRLGNRVGQASILNNLGIVHREEGRLTEAGECYAQALRLYRELGNRYAEWSCLGNVGVVQLELDQLPDAVRAQQAALDGYTSLAVAEQPLNDIANVLHNLAVGLRALGQPSLAVLHLTRALVIRRQVGNRYGAATDLDQLAAAYVDLGYHAKAQDLAEECLSIARAIGRRRVEAEALATLGAVALGLHGPAAALDLLHRALRLAREIGYRRAEVNAHLGLAAAYRVADRHREAASHAQMGEQLAHAAQHHLLARQARALRGPGEPETLLRAAC
ncbi:tetratricopeptide repeat protein [Micromonospora sp. LAH09]|uniref:AfsR/SARP family transcriptional regulator n=1 Tax=Micromonospora cabrerizensis TaxID=2911213 RepID=UPI001EE78312|nr:AfsR/SARP family transcriptional regulator [Micromonospora cabrerizensis]MCG5468207.1 tetratricopeptide repeat protein [Micromonospora cabrerizensis]